MIARRVFIIVMVSVTLLLASSLHAQAPPSLPATIYGNVTILCSTGGSRYAPAGLVVSAIAPDGTLVGSTQTGEGTSEEYMYILKIEGYSGQADIYVSEVYVASVDVYPGLVEELNLEVADNIPPSAPSSISAGVDNGYLSLTWSASYDNLAVDYYIVRVYSGDQLLYEATTTSTSWTSPEPLDEGVYTVSVVAVDLACNQGPASNATVLIDTTPPAIVAAEPANGSIVPNSTFTAVFTVMELSGIAQIDLVLDGSVPVTDYSLARVNETHLLLYVELRDLSEGSHTLEITLADELGNTGSSQYYFTVDTTPPSITFISTINGSWINKTSFNVYALVLDEVSGVDIDTITVTLDGSPASFDYVESNGTLIIYVSSVPGWHNLTVSAADRAGHVAVSQVSFGIDVSPPQVDFASPENGTVYTVNNVNVTAYVVDDLSGVREDSVKLLVNGTEHYYEYDNATGRLQALIFLNNGVWNISIAAEDLAGNKIMKYVIIEIQSEAPSIILLSPGLLVKGPQVQIAANITSTAGLDSVIIKLDGRVIDRCDCNGENEYSYNKTVELASGLHTLNITALDINGLSSTLSYAFTVDNEPPRFESSNIANKSVLTSNIITFKVTVSDRVSGVDANSITILLNGRPVSYSYDRETGVVSAALTLEPGLNTVKISVKDRAGWRASAKYYLVYDNDSPVIHADKFYFVDPEASEPRITISVEDVSLEAISIGVYPRVELQPSIGTVKYTDKGIIIDLDIPKYTPYKVTVVFEDPAGRKASQSFHLVIAERADITLEIAEGRQVLIVPGGVFTDILEYNLSLCTSSYWQVNSDWSLSDAITDFNYTILLVDSPEDCRLSIVGFNIPLKGEMVVERSGNKIIVAPFENIPVDDLAARLGVESDVIVIYFYDRAAGAWTTSVVAGGGVLGGLHVLSENNVYFIYAGSYPRSEGGASLHAAPASKTSDYDTVSFSLAEPVVMVTAALASIAAWMLRVRRPPSLGYAGRIIAAVVLVAGALATPAASQTAQLVEASENVAAPTGYAPLQFTVQIEGSANTSAYLLLESSQEFELVSVEVVVDGRPQEVAIEARDNGYAVYSEALNPPSGVLTINVVVYTESDLDLNWTIIIAMAHDVPVEPLIEAGTTRITYADGATQTETTTTTTTETTITTTTTTTTTQTTTTTTTYKGTTTTTTTTTETTTTTTTEETTLTTTTPAEGGTSKWILVPVIVIIAIAAAVLIYLRFGGVIGLTRGS